MTDMYMRLIEYLEPPGTHSVHNIANALCEYPDERQDLVDAIYTALRKGDALMVWQDGDLRFYATHNY